MAAVKKRQTYAAGSVTRVSPLKPGLRGARNWASAQMRAAGHTRKGFIRFSLSIFAVLFAVVFFALWIGGFLPQIRQGISDFKEDRLIAMGFVIEQVDVMGEGRLNEDDVKSVIGIYPGDYFFGADLKTAQKRAESLPWVDRAVVRRLWPNRIVVQLVEVEAYALWQREGQFTLVGKGGEEIAPLKGADINPQGLKILIGQDAPKYAYAFQKELEAFPEIWARTEGLTYLNSGRWDLHLKGGVRVKLPRVDHIRALRMLAQVHEKKQILDKNITSLDLRLSDRITIAPVGFVAEAKRV